MRLITFLFIFLPFFTNAQSLFVDEPASVFGLSLGSISNTTTFNLAYGYAFDEKTEIFTNIGRSTFDDVSNLSETGLQLGSRYFVLKQDYETPISVSLGGAYTYSWISGNALQGASANGSTFSTELGIYHAIELDDITIYPFAGMTYSTTKVSIGNGATSFSESSSGLSYNLGGSFSFKAGSGQLVLTPVLLFSNGDSGFLVSLAYINR